MTSRQRQWQLRQKAAGRCVRCGKRERVTVNHCEECRKKHNAKVLRRYHEKKVPDNSKRV